MGANAIFNILERNDIVTLAEGLNVFTTKTPPELVGKNLMESQIRQKTGCNIISIRSDSEQTINPDPEFEIPQNSELVLVGTTEDEKKFMETFK